MIPLLLRFAGILLVLVMTLAAGIIQVGKLLPGQGQLMYRVSDLEHQLRSVDVATRVEVTLARHLATDFLALISPDGSLILYLSVYDETTGAGNIYLANSDGSNLRLAHPNVSPFFASRRFHWLSDSRRLMFLEYQRDYSIVVRTIDLLDDSEERMPVAWSTDCFQYISPNGQYVALIAPIISAEGERCEGGVSIMNIDGSNRRDYELPQQDGFFTVYWSPDSSRCIVLNGNQLYLINVAENTFAQISESNPLTVSRFFGWSPDSTHIASGAYNVLYTVRIQPEMESPQLLIPETEVLSSMVWSPDNSHIAFVGIQNRNTEIYIMDANGANIQRVTVNDSVEGNLVWLP